MRKVPAGIKTMFSVVTLGPSSTFEPRGSGAPWQPEKKIARSTVRKMNESLFIAQLPVVRIEENSTTTNTSSTTDRTGTVLPIEASGLTNSYKV